MARVTLKNDFHNTEVTVVVPKSGRLSKSQIKRVRKELCGMDDCWCGTVRGPQDVEISWEYETMVIR